MTTKNDKRQTQENEVVLLGSIIRIIRSIYIYELNKKVKRKKEEQALFFCVPCLAYFLYLLRGRVSGIGNRTCRSAPPSHE